MNEIKDKQIFFNVMGSTYSERVHHTEDGIALEHYISGETKVVAYCFDDEGRCQIIGHGTFMGFIDVPIVDDEDQVIGTLDSPQILLDDGRYIYGYQCWWDTLTEWERELPNLIMSDKPVEWEEQE